MKRLYNRSYLVMLLIVPLSLGACSNSSDPTDAASASTNNDAQILSITGVFGLNIKGTLAQDGNVKETVDATIEALQQAPGSKNIRGSISSDNTKISFSLENVCVAYTVSGKTLSDPVKSTGNSSSGVCTTLTKATPSSN